MKLINTFREYPNTTSKQKRTYGVYKCTCGKQVTCLVSNVKRGLTKSCGCLIGKSNITHGLSTHPLYTTWSMMIQRTTNPKHTAYKYYGAKGIKVCKRWLNVEHFIEDMYPSYTPGLSLDRINNDGNYELSNCRWASKETQSQNTVRLCKTNTSGYRGVFWDKQTNKYRVQITVNKKTISLGRFENTIEAAQAYDKYIINNNLKHTRNFT